MQCLNFACHLTDFSRGSLLANDHLTVILESCLVKGGREERERRETGKAKHLVLCWETKKSGAWFHCSNELGDRI